MSPIRILIEQPGCRWLLQVEHLERLGLFHGEHVQASTHWQESDHLGAVVDHLGHYKRSEATITLTPDDQTVMLNVQHDDVEQTYTAHDAQFSDETFHADTLGGIIERACELHAQRLSRVQELCQEAGA